MMYLKPQHVSSKAKLTLGEACKSALFLLFRKLFLRTESHHAQLYLLIRTRACPDGGEVES